MANQVIQCLGGWTAYLTTIDGEAQTGSVRLYGTATHWHLLLNMDEYRGGELARLSIRAIEIGCSRIMAEMNIPTNRKPNSSKGRWIRPRLDVNFGTISKMGIEGPFPGSFLMTIWTQGRVCTVRFAQIDWEALQLASRQYPAPADLRVFREPATESVGQLIENRVEAVFPVQNDSQTDIFSYVIANNHLTDDLKKAKIWRPVENVNEYYQPGRWGKQAIVTATYKRKLLSRASKAALDAEVNQRVKPSRNLAVATDPRRITAQPVVVQEGWHQETGLHWAVVEYATKRLPKVRTPGRLTIPKLFLELKKAKAEIRTCQIGWLDRETMLFTVAVGLEVPRYDEAWCQITFLLPFGWAHSQGQEVWEPGEYDILSDYNLIYQLPAAMLRRPVLHAYEQRRKADQAYARAWSAFDSEQYKDQKFYFETERTYFQLLAEDAE